RSRTSRSRWSPGWPRTSARACTSTWPRAPRTSTPAGASSATPTTAGYSPTPSTSTGTSRGPSCTTRGPTSTTPSATGARTGSATPCASAPTGSGRTCSRSSASRSYACAPKTSPRRPRRCGSGSRGTRGRASSGPTTPWTHGTWPIRRASARCPSASTARSSTATASRPRWTPGRCGRGPASRRRACTRDCEPVTTPVAIYLQDAHPLREAMHWAQAAEQAGFAAVWQAESRLVRDAVVPMAAFGATTERIRIGSGVASIWTRNPAVLASTFATLDDLAPGRVICGLGAWWDPLARKVGISRDHPLTVMREVVIVVRALLHDETVTFDGTYVHLDGVELDYVHQ